jgi:hypothetical protein
LQLRVPHGEDYDIGRNGRMGELVPVHGVRQRIGYTQGAVPAPSHIRYSTVTDFARLRG